MYLPPYDAAKNLAGNLDYFRRPCRLARYLRLLSWGSLLVCLILVAFVLLPRHHKALQAGPVSAAHAMFNDDCARCHQDAFQTATRIWHGDKTHSVPDRACTVCHPGPNHQEIKDGRPAITAEHCAECHKEHRGRGFLAWVPDGHCVRCHANPTDIRADTRLERVPDFGRHPEFALLRTKAADPGTIKFNHQVHLNLPREARGIDKPLARLQEQRCGFCHEPDAPGRYMKPVRYEAHCRECHPLSVAVVGEPLASAAALGAFAAQPALHPGLRQTAAVVRADLRQRLLRFAQENPKRVPPWSLAASLVAQLAFPLAPASATLPGLARSTPASVAKATPLPSIPGTRRAPPSTPEQLGWVDFQLWHAERSLFDGGDGCRRCHAEKTPLFSRPNGLPEYLQPYVNERWYTSSRFDHKAHRLLNCVECHDKAATSVISADVILPGVATCKRCHNKTDGAKSDCVECHVFHHGGGTVWRGSLRIDQALR